MLFPPLVLDFPALPVLVNSHSLLAPRVKALRPLLGRCRTETQSVVEFLGDLCYMLLVIVFSYFYICRGCRGLQGVGGNVIVVVRDESKRESGSQCGGGREEKARVLRSQSRSGTKQVQLTVWHCFSRHVPHALIAKGHIVRTPVSPGPFCHILSPGVKELSL